MAEKTNILPPTNLRAPWAVPFWEGLSKRVLRGQTCADCGAAFFPPRPCCPECLSDRLAWVELDGRGTLHSWTQVRVAGPEFDTPFLLGLIDLSGGVGRIAAKISGADEGQLRIGMPVRVAYLKTTAGFDAYCLELDDPSTHPGGA